MNDLGWFVVALSRADDNLGQSTPWLTAGSITDLARAGFAPRLLPKSESVLYYARSLIWHRR